MNTSHVVMSALALALVVSAGCKKDPEPKPEPKPTPVSLPGYPEPNELPIVAVSKPGTGEKTTLRYALEKGQRERLTMVMGMRMGIEAGGVDRDVKTPTMTAVYDIEVADVDGEDLKLEMTQFGDFEVADDAPAAMVEQMRSTVKAFVIPAIKVEHTTRGLVRSVAYTLGDDPNPMMKQMMESMERAARNIAVPFPEEPVGVGAQWTAKQTVDMMGLRIFQTGTFEVVRLIEGGAVLKVSVVQTAPAQEFELPGALGMTAELHSMESTGTGETTVRFKHSAPDVKLAIKTAMSMTNMGQDIKMTMALETTMTSASIP